MRPGATIRPSASITRSARAAPGTWPTAAIRPREIATPARRRARAGAARAARADPPARDRDVGAAPREAGAVDDDTAADHEVMAHRRMLSRDRFRGRQILARAPAGGRAPRGRRCLR